MNPSTAADRAHRTIRERIIDGTYPPGMMLSENELAQQLGVSRTPVRAALARLQDDDWITVYPKRGALVRTLDAHSVTEIAETRLVMEAAGVEHATVADRIALAQQLERVVALQQEALQCADVATFVDLAVQFHRAFVEVGHNAYLLALCERTSDRQRQLLFQQRDSLCKHEDVIIREHRELIDLLRQEDTAQFGDALRRHLSLEHEGINSLA